MLLRKSICALDHTLYVDGNNDVVPGVSPVQINTDCPSAATDLYTSLIEHNGV